MGFRFRKSMKIAPGVRLNLGSKSAGLSFGSKGFRYSVSTSGRRTTTMGIPGTGMSWSNSSSHKSNYGFWYWVCIGWWWVLLKWTFIAMWWMCRILFYDIPKFLIMFIVKLYLNIKTKKGDQ